MYQAISAYAAWISAFLTALIFLANIFYVAKFRESVDMQRKTSQGALIMGISNQFFYNEPHKRIIRRIDEKKSLRSKSGGFSDTELDDHIGFLDSIGTFVRAGILDEHLVWAFFSHHIESAYECPEIAEYVTASQTIDPAYFEDFVWIRERMQHQKSNRQLMETQTARMDS
jgi:hypothetical protein